MSLYQVHEAYNYAQISASANVMACQGALAGIFVSSGSGTITVYDSKTTTTTKKVVDTFAVLPGNFYPLPFLVDAGLYVVIAGTMSVTVGFNGN